MGGVTKWNVLNDTDISTAMPEVFAPPPEIVSGFMEKEVEQALIEWNPLIARIIKKRGLFGSAPRARTEILSRRQRYFRHGGLGRFLRRHFFDYFGRR
jgi:tRNA(adenine34) deaminase